MLLKKTTFFLLRPILACKIPNKTDQQVDLSGYWLLNVMDIFHVKFQTFTSWCTIFDIFCTYFLHYYISITSIKLPMESFQIFIWKAYSRKFCSERKLESEMKWNFEHLFELATLEINAIWRMQYFFWYCLNTTVCKFNNCNFSTVNAI